MNETIKNVLPQENEVYAITHVVVKGDNPDEVWTNDYLGFAKDIESAETFARDYLTKERFCKLTEPYVARDREIVFTAPNLGGLVETIDIHRIKKIA